MSLTKSELNRIATLFAKMDSADSKVVADMYKKAASARQANIAAKFNVGDAVAFASKRGGMVKGIVEKVNRKTIKVKSGATMWSVSPSLLRFQY